MMLKIVNIDNKFHILKYYYLKSYILVYIINIIVFIIILFIFSTIFLYQRILKNYNKFALLYTLSGYNVFVLQIIINYYYINLFYQQIHKFNLPLITYLFLFYMQVNMI